jgi:zinc protease
VFYRRHYRPDNTVFILGGRFDPAKALASINASFGRLANAGQKTVQLSMPELPQDGEREVTLRQIGARALLGFILERPPASPISNWFNE